jgi:phage terminase small subunit
MQSNSTQFAVETAKDLAAPLPTPPQHLDEHAATYWADVINSKRRSAWTPADLLVACQLCRDLAAVDVLSQELETYGAVLEDAKGKRYSNPAARLLDAATRRTLAASKHLQIHAHATQGRSQEQRGKNETARALQDKVTSADDLIARPGMAH